MWLFIKLPEIVYIFPTARLQGRGEKQSSGNVCVHPDQTGCRRTAEMTVARHEGHVIFADPALMTIFP